MSVQPEGNAEQSIAGAIKELDKKERDLRLELESVRKQRDDIKSKVGYKPDTDRFEFLDDMPNVFWYPIYIFSMFFSELNPVRENNFSPPDKQDWIKKGGNKEAFVNLVLAALFLFLIGKFINFIL